MKITLLAFAVIFLTASTFAESPSPDSTTENVVPSSALPTEKPDTSVSPKVTSTSSSSPAPTTTSSSSPPTTSSPSPSPTTTSSPSPSPTTTSSSSEPTTTPSPEPTTTSSTTPETTPSHETTSVTPSPSTVPPIPVPQPGYWNVTDGNTTCIRANLAIRFRIETNGVVNYIVLSPTASSEGSKCNTSDGTEVLLLKDIDYNVMFVFEKSSDEVYVKNISFTYYLPISTETFTNDTHFFRVKSGYSYLCKTPSDVVLGNATMEIISIQVRAFGPKNNEDFGSVDECGADSPINDIVPIAVGVALLALVVVVLIAYLVGRRRSRQKGYQSV